MSRVGSRPLTKAAARVVATTEVGELSAEERAHVVRRRLRSTGKDTDFGRWLRQNRIDRDMPLRELAAMTKISNGYLSEIENGKRLPNETQIREIARATGGDLLTLVRFVQDERARRNARNKARAQNEQERVGRGRTKALYLDVKARAAHGEEKRTAILRAICSDMVQRPLSLIRFLSEHPLVDVSTSSVGAHLRKLAREGLVTVHAESYTTTVQITRAGRERALAGGWYPPYATMHPELRALAEQAVAGAGQAFGARTFDLVQDTLPGGSLSAAPSPAPAPALRLVPPPPESAPPLDPYEGPWPADAAAEAIRPLPLPDESDLFARMVAIEEHDRVLHLVTQATEDPAFLDDPMRRAAFLARLVDRSRSLFAHDAFLDDDEDEATRDTAPAPPPDDPALAEDDTS